MPKALKNINASAVPLLGKKDSPGYLILSGKRKKLFLKLWPPSWKCRGSTSKPAAGWPKKSWAFPSSAGLTMRWDERKEKNGHDESDDSSFAFSLGGQRSRRSRGKRDPKDRPLCGGNRRPRGPRRVGPGKGTRERLQDNLGAREGRPFFAPPFGRR